MIPLWFYIIYSYIAILKIIMGYGLNIPMGTPESTVMFSFIQLSSHSLL